MLQLKIKNCFSASGHACSNTLCQVAKVVVKAVVLDVLVWPLYEVELFQGVDGHLFDARVGRARCVVGYEGGRWLGRAVCFLSYQEARGVDVVGACDGVTDREVTGCVPGL